MTIITPVVKINIYREEFSIAGPKPLSSLGSVISLYVLRRTFATNKNIINIINQIIFFIQKSYHAFS